MAIRCEPDPEHCTPTRSNALVEDNLGLVQHIVNQVSMRYPRHVDRQELWNAGALGLVDAARRYDPSIGIPFPRYASIRIRGAIIDSTRSRDWATRSTRRRIRESRQATEALRQDLGREPTTEEVADRLDVEPEHVETSRAAAVTASLLHLDQHIGGEDGSTTLGDLVEEEDTYDLPQEQLEEQELVGTLHVAVDHLPEPQRMVIKRYYFGGDYLKDIAETLGVTEARISQIRSEAMDAIRAYFDTVFDGVPNVDHSAPGRRNRTAYLETMRDATDWLGRLRAAEQPVPA